MNITRMVLRRRNRSGPRLRGLEGRQSAAVEPGDGLGRARGSTHFTLSRAPLHREFLRLMAEAHVILQPAKDEAGRDRIPRPATLLRSPAHAVRREGLARDVLHNGDGALDHERNGLSVATHAVARDTAPRHAGSCSGQCGSACVRRAALVAGLLARHRRRRARHGTAGLRPPAHAV